MSISYDPNIGLDGAMPSKDGDTPHVQQESSWFGSSAVEEDESPVTAEQEEKGEGVLIYNADEFLPGEARRRKVPPVSLSPAKETKKEKSKLTQKEIDLEIRAEQEYFGKMVPGLQPEEDEEEEFEPPGGVVEHPFPGRNPSDDPYGQYQEQIRQEHMVHHPEDEDMSPREEMTYRQEYGQESLQEHGYAQQPLGQMQQMQMQQTMEEPRTVSNMFPEPWQPQDGDQVTKNGHTLAKIGIFLLIVAIIVFVAVVVARRSVKGAIAKAIHSTK
jgi:hypothetical protein